MNLKNLTTTFDCLLALTFAPAVYVPHRSLFVHDTSPKFLLSLPQKRPKYPYIWTRSPSKLASQSGGPVGLKAARAGHDFRSETPPRAGSFLAFPSPVSCNSCNPLRAYLSGTHNIFPPPSKDGEDTDMDGVTVCRLDMCSSVLHVLYMCNFYSLAFTPPPFALGQRSIPSPSPS